jgi:hypothetical protein
MRTDGLGVMLILALAQGCAGTGASAASNKRPILFANGMTLPRPVDPGCVEKGLEGLAPFGGSQGRVEVRFAVDSDGRVDEVENAKGIYSRATLWEIEDALRRCEWIPGKDLDGRPASIWVSISFDLGSKWPIQAPWVDSQPVRVR